ncbi:ABC transporter ATP-binding protein [uncultured Roseibium sp.]|uniref:ABC transporter ATP-binding protein n=1 Tax=uncultured Roseibium sp. TaxID=1936171 RepID=UPI0026099C55|nr:ABC transporter ATP-binding protein [uncultured Roseibium sp.]
MASVEISGLRKLYGSVVALSDINVSIPSGTFYTLLGPSGCGKTTLLRTIAGFHSQSSGDISVEGRSIAHLPAHQRDVAMVFQDYAVFPHLSVRDNIAFGLKQRRIEANEIRQRVDQVMEVVQLGKFANRMPHELSGGQQQRVGLARAIVVRPKVLLMDEPLSNLDAKLRVDLRAELRRIQQDLGVTTIYVTHDQEEALALSDVVCVMEGGVIQQAASPLDVYLRPANRFVASFVGSNNFLDVDCSGAEAALKCGGEQVLLDLPNQHSGDAVCAIRPEDITVVPGKGSSASDRPEISIPVRIKEVSFIGREMEVFGVTEHGETLKSVSRSDPSVIDLPLDSDAQFCIERHNLSFFEKEPLGGRIG